MPQVPLPNVPLEGGPLGGVQIRDVPIRSEPMDSAPVQDLPVQSVVLSLDIDGTLEDGDPPGPLPMSLVLQAQALGYVVGSASDRTVREQNRMWERRGIVPDFVGHKHHLDRVAVRFPGARMIHIGDTEVDAHYARLAGFEFFWSEAVPPSGSDGWIF